MAGKYSLVAIEWADSYTPLDSWLEVEEVKDLAKERRFEVCSVGFLIHEDRDCVVIAARIGDDGQQCGLVERLPKRAIFSRRVIETVSKSGR